MSNILFTEDEIQKAVKKIAFQISEDEYKKSGGFTPVFICVLNGAFMFFSDLVKELNFNFQIDFIRAKSYTGHTSDILSINKDIELNILHRTIYLIDDIYDSGQTINTLTKHLEKYLPEEIIPVTLFKKQHIKSPSNLIFGIELKDESFLVGYGLDNSQGYQRNLKYILGEHSQD
jgi:hypoxanthine phosphoribosyltransferase